MNHIPPLSKDLIDLLDVSFPRVLPNPTVLRDIELYESGKRYVVDFLKQLQKETEDNEFYSS